MNLLLRSMLFVPTYQEKFVKKAIDCTADAIIFDLEDAVPSLVRPQGRQILEETLQKRFFQGKQIFIRVNEVETTDFEADLNLLSCPDVTGLVLPKIDDARDILKIESLVARKETDCHLPLNSIKFAILLETASAFLHLEEIAAASQRSVALLFGGEDYLDSIHGIHTNHSSVFDVPRALLVQVARKYKLAPIDTPYLDIRNEIGFKEEAQKSFASGFSGMTLVNPIQIPWANESFSPSEKEVSHAVQVITAVQEAKNGIALLDGKMIGPPMYKRAQKVIALSKMIAEKEYEKGHDL